MARKIAGGFGKQAAVALALACLLMPAPRAEDLGAPPAAPPMSPPCDVPATDIQYTVRLARDANYVA